MALESMPVVYGSDQPWSEQNPTDLKQWGPPSYDPEDLRRRLQQMGGGLYNDTDFESATRNLSYTNPDGSPKTSFDAVLGSFQDIYNQRAQSHGGSSGPNYQTPAQQWNSQPFSQQSSDLFRLLMDRAQQGTAIDRNNPMVRQQVDPAVAQQQRASRSYLDQLAEQSGPFANLQGERRLASERSGQAAGALESEVIGRLQQQALEERQQALGLAQQYGTAQDRNALEREIAMLQDATQRRGQDNSYDEFLRELGLRQYDLTNQWDYNWQTMGL